MRWLALLFCGLAVGAMAAPKSQPTDDPHLDPYTLFDAVPRPRGPAVVVEWLVQADPNDTCQRVMGRRTPYQVEACAVFVPTESRCVIITGPKTNLHTLGHELRHCVQGDWHGEPPPGTYVPDQRPMR